MHTMKANLDTRSQKRRSGVLAPAFVTTVLTSGCAWTYGGGVQYTHGFDRTNGVAVNGRVAWGFGAGRNALVVAADLGMGTSPKHNGFWVQSTPRLEWSWLPHRGDVGLRLGLGGFIAGTTANSDSVSGPAMTSEVLYGLDEDSHDIDRGYRATLLGFGLQLAYDAADPMNGPLLVFHIAVTRDAVLPFGNPPRPRNPAPAVSQIATEPQR
jgi:hypothetical protein